MTASVVIQPRQLAREALVERMGGKPPEEWAGSCHGASLAVVEAIAEMGHPVGAEGVAIVRRGYFVGEVAKGSYFDGRPAQHSWVELLKAEPEWRVLDPTRFAFTREPSWPLWIGPDDDYDIGGCRMAPPAGPAPDVFETEGELYELHLGSTAYVADLLGHPHDLWGDGDDDPDDAWIEISREQAHWLGNLPVKDKEAAGVLSRFFAAEVYAALRSADLGAVIPIDRLDWILPEHSEKAGLR